MKKINLFWLAAFLLILPLGVTSCSDDEEDGPGSSAALIGTWELEYDLYQAYKDGKLVYEEEERDPDPDRIIFKEDGTCMSGEYYNGRWDWDDNVARWSYKNGKLTLSYLDESYDGPAIVLVKELTATKLVVESSEKYREEGVSYEYYERTEFRKIVE